MAAGSRLLQIILDIAEGNPAISEAYLHVHVSNEDAFAFYARWGFVRGELVEDYYRRLQPRHAVILRRSLSSTQPAAWLGC